MKRKSEEKKLSYLIAEFMEIQYPNVIFRFDVASDLRMSIGQAMVIKNKLRHKRGFPDLHIAKASKGYHGLYIELKRDGDEIFKQDGAYKKQWDKKTQSDHIQEQHEMHERLRAEGYYVVWGLGFEDTISKIKEYLYEGTVLISEEEANRRRK